MDKLKQVIPFTQNNLSEADNYLPKYLTTLSNIASKYIVEKTVINAMHNIYSKELDLKMPNYCKDSMFSIFTSMNKMFYMPYERDDLSNDQFNEVFYDERFESNNNWDSIEMPNGNTIDRDAFSSIKVQKSNFSELQSKSKEVIPTQTKKKKPVDLLSKENKDSDRKRTIAIKMNFEPYVDKDDNKLIEDEATKLLRENKLKSIQTNEQKQQEKFAKSNDINNPENQKKQKELENKQKTADAEGNLIVIKGIHSEKLNNDFIIPLPNIYNRAVSAQDVKEMSNPIVIKQGVKVKEKTDSIEELQSLKSNTGIAKKKGKKETFINNISNNTKSDLNPIIPAGSSYDMILPEVGVTIIETGKSKDGGMNFLKSFRKHSKYDYENMLKETIGINSLKGTMEQILSQTMDEAEHKEVVFPLINNKFKTQYLSKESGNQSLKSVFSKSNDLIQFNKTQGASLRKALDGLNSNEELDSLLPSLKETKNSNLFKTHKSTKETIKDEEKNKLKSNMNDYNNNLASFNQTFSSNVWGTSSSFKRDNLYNKTDALKYIKPNMKEIEKEVGIDIMNKKIPKARLKTEARHLQEDYKDDRHIINTGDRLDFKKFNN